MFPFINFNSTSFTGINFFIIKNHLNVQHNVKYLGTDYSMQTHTFIYISNNHFSISVLCNIQIVQILRKYFPRKRKLCTFICKQFIRKFELLECLQQHLKINCQKNVTCRVVPECLIFLRNKSISCFTDCTINNRHF